MKPVEIVQGTSPIILGQPHSGTYVPDHIYANLNQTGRKLIDTDWHIPKLYEGLAENVSIVRANFSRYVIDANRDPSGTSLYPGQNTTELVPLTTFDNQPIWNKPPGKEDIAHRLSNFHCVYHQALQAEIDRVKGIHGMAVLYDCHSIRSEIPFLFDEKLPDFNIGDNSGHSCDMHITKIVEEACRQFPNYRTVVNGRFKGGWTTRQYGRPENNVHAIQMELAQHCYLVSEQWPFTYAADKASEFRKVLALIFAQLTPAFLFNFKESQNESRS